jgi:hypothetical protein
MLLKAAQYVSIILSISALIVIPGLYVRGIYLKTITSDEWKQFVRMADNLEKHLESEFRRPVCIRVQPLSRTAVEFRITGRFTVEEINSAITNYELSGHTDSNIAISYILETELRESGKTTGDQNVISFEEEGGGVNP